MSFVERTTILYPYLRGSTLGGLVYYYLLITFFYIHTYKVLISSSNPVIGAPSTIHNAMGTLKNFVCRSLPFHWYRPPQEVFSVKKYLHGYQSFLNLTLAFASGRVIIYLFFTPLARYTDSAVDNGDGTGSAVVNCCWNKLLDQV